MHLLKAIRVAFVIVIAFGLFGHAPSTRAEDENTRPRRVRATAGESVEADPAASEAEHRTGVSVTRKRRHGVVRRSAVATAKGTSEVATSVAEGTATGAKYVARESSKGAKVAGKETAKGAKTTAKGTKTASKKVVDAFK